MSTKAQIKKYERWLWITPAFIIFFVAPVAINITPALVSIDIRILLNYALGLFLLFLGGFALFAPREKLFEHKIVKPNPGLERRRTITAWCLRILGIPMFLLAIWWLYPLTVGSFNLFILHQPFGTFRDEVIYVHSSGGRSATSDTACIYISCTLRFRNQPEKDYEYIYAPGIRIGDLHTFLILPGTNQIVANTVN